MTAAEQIKAIESLKDAAIREVTGLVKRILHALQPQDEAARTDDSTRQNEPSLPRAPERSQVTPG